MLKQTNTGDTCRSGVNYMFGVLGRDASYGEYGNLDPRSDLMQLFHTDSRFPWSVKDGTEHNEVGMRAFGIDRFL